VSVRHYQDLVCDVELKVGSKYLIYAKRMKNSDSLQTTYQPLKAFDEKLGSLKFLDSLGDGKPEFRIVVEPSILSFLNYELSNNFQIDIWKDRQKIISASNNYGRFDIPVDTEGQYKVQIWLPNNKNIFLVKPRYYPETFSRVGKVKNKRFVEYNVQVKPDNCGFIHLAMLDRRDFND
jgi:hypothetical protein